MELRLGESQERLRVRVRELLETEAWSIHGRSAPASRSGWSAELWKRLADGGFLRVPFARQAGGEVAGFLDACLVLEELGRARTPTPFLPTTILGGSAIARWGDERQKERLLTAVERGECTIGFADAEPGSSWGAAPAGTGVGRSGDGYLLEGVKSFVSYARTADYLLVTALLDEAAPHAGRPVLLLVDPRARGVSVEELESLDADSYCTVRFDRVELPPDALLGAESAGHDGGELGLVRQWGAAARCAEMVGGADRVLEMCIEFAKKRRQFQRPIGSFQAVQHRCADMAVDALSSRLVTYEAVWRLGQGLPARQEVSVAKAWVGEAYARICASGHQIHGAIGYTAGHRMQQFFRHARSAELAFGDSDYHREILAQQLGM